MGDALKLAIENLYLVFSIYKISNIENISCFDFGPSPEELSGVSKDLRDIPDGTLAGMEFYAYGWDSWGTKNEVGYFLPRLMEYLANDVERLEYPGLFSLFKYKLCDLFSDTNDDWTHKEKESISEFIKAVLLERLSVDNDVGMLIECALALNLDPQHILSNWNSDEQLHKKQVVALLEHFNCPVYGTPEGVYFKDSARIRVFLDLLFEQLTPEEIAEISYGDLHSEREVSELINVSRRWIASTSRRLGIGSIVNFVRYFTDEEVRKLRSESLGAPPKRQD